MEVFVTHYAAASWLNISRGVLLMLLASSAAAEESNWRTSWDGVLYGYVSSTGLRDDSVLNPGNHLAKLAQRSDTVEARFNLKAESEAVRISARPILLTQQARNSFGDTNTSASFLSQWQARWRAGETLALSGGRELLNWGPAQFCSPSNPFYFNNGRRNPMSELSGMEAVRLSWSPEVSTSLYAARLFGSGHGHADPDPWANAWLLKADWRGEESAAGLALVQPGSQAVFVGAHAQRTVSDAWLLYGELGSSTRSHALISSADASQPFTIEAETSRYTDALLGAAYTFESGYNFTAEYLSYGHGYDAAASSAYFARAASAASIFPTGNSSPTLASALTSAPALLGRDYLHLVWQSNLMESGAYWRLMYTRNLTDAGDEVGIYGETVLAGQLSAYLLAVLPQGGARQEFSALFQYAATLGLKIAMP